jgi:hypothetical protein
MIGPKRFALDNVNRANPNGMGYMGGMIGSALRVEAVIF